MAYMRLQIVRLLLASDTFESTCDDTYVSSVLKRCAEWGPWGDNIQSSPLVTWSRQYDDIVEALVSRGIKYETLVVSDDYEYLATFAPAEYDYTGFGTIHVCALPTDDPRRTERLVAIPWERLEYQTGRYASGMYGTRKFRFKVP